MKNLKWKKVGSAVLATALAGSMVLPATAYAQGEIVQLEGGTSTQTNTAPEQVFLNKYSGTVRTQNFNDNWKFYLGDASGAQTPAFDDSSWDQVNLPHDYSIDQKYNRSMDGESGYLPGGTGWYRKSFTVDKSLEGKRISIDFGGVYMNATIYVNGKKLGTHPYGYTPFSFDITDNVKFGKENVIAVKVDHQTPSSRFYSGSGIYRDVDFVVTDTVHVDKNGTKIETPDLKEHVDGNNVAVKVKTTVVNESERDASVKVKHTIYPKNGTAEQAVATFESQEAVAVEKGKSKDVSADFTASGVQLWSTTTPNLYTVKTEVLMDGATVDTYETDYGFRYFAFDKNNGFTLNGQKMKLQGVCMHHDLGALGTAINKSAIERQINILKSFGANAIRTSHNPPAPELLELADKMGILILDEVFDCWASGKNENDYAVHYSEWHKKDIEALVCRDRNHPSVIMWSLGNEVEEQYHPEKGVAAYLRDIVRLYDSTRPVTFGASYPSKSAINGTELQVDVHGMNYPSGGYGGPDFYETFLNYPGHEHLSGFASESSSTISSRGVYFPKGYQVTSYDLKAPGWASLADAEFAALDKYPAICGEFVWTGFDYLGEPTPFNSDMSVLLNHAALSEEELAKAKEELKRIEKERPSSRSSYFGIVDLAGFPKDRYYLYKAHWMPDEPMAYILPHWNFPDRIGKITPVFVYSSGDEVELFLNGESLGRKKKEQYQYRFKWENVIYTPGELKAIAYKNGKLWATESVRTTGEPALLQVSAYKDKIKVADNELAFITVSIRDKTGSVVPTANHKIKCKLEGEGKIVATDNGDPTSLISFSATERETFNGFMLVVIKAHQGAKGKLRLIVESENLKSASVDINLL